MEQVGHPPEGQCCSTCRFGIEEIYTGILTCRRHAPHSASDVGWPEVGGEDWCGDYEQWLPSKETYYANKLLDP